MKKNSIHCAIQTRFRDEAGKYYLRSKSGEIRKRPAGTILASILQKLQPTEKLIQITLTIK